MKIARIFRRICQNPRNLAVPTGERQTHRERRWDVAMKEQVSKVSNAAAVVHVRFGGRSFDVPLTVLDLGVGSRDGDVKGALARHLEVHPSRLMDYVVDRHGNGNLTVRPEAVFG